MDCNEARSRLHAYLDDELDAPGVAEVDRHIASCAACRQVIGQFSALKSGVRAYARYHAAPDGLAARIRTRLGDSTGEQPKIQRTKDPEATRALPGDRRYGRFGRWLELGAVAAAAAAVSWLGALQYASPSPDETIFEQVMAGHARAVLTSHVVDVETSDQHTVKPWLSSKLDFSPPVVDLASAGFPLLGGRLDYLDHRPVAAIVYQARQHVIDLYVWPDDSVAGSASTQASAKRGYNVVHWGDGGMQYWAVSDLNAGELQTFAERYSAATLAERPPAR